jgi:benzoate transport
MNDIGHKVEMRPSDSLAMGDQMTSRQWLAVGVCILLNVIDGFDILVMATAASAVAADFAISTSRLGLVLSASLLGMMLGALLISPLADKVGRRPVILVCLALEFSGMLAAGYAHNIEHLLVLRLITGLGVGGIMPVINTAVAELSTPRRRNIAITAQATGYPLGGLIAAILGSVILGSHDWRLLLQLACIPTAVAFALVLFYLPESVDYLLARRPRNALQRINVALRTLGKPPMVALPETVSRTREGMTALLGPALLPLFILFSAATFLTQFSFYFFLSWLPTVLAPHLQAIPMQSAGSMLLNLGGIAGDILFGFLCVRFAARTLTLAALLTAFASIAMLGFQLASPLITATLPLVAGAALFGAMVGIYATAPRVFPPLVRAAGTGIAFSLGRFGGALSPIVGAYALAGPTLDTATALILLALPLVAAAALLALLTERRLEPAGGLGV